MENNQEKIYTASFDTIDDVLSNINYSLKKVIINQEEININKNIEEW